MAPRKKTTASNNVFKTIVRDVVKEELVPVNKRFDSIDRKFDSVDRRFNSIEEKLEQIEDTFQKFRNDIIDHLEKIHPHGQHAQI